MKTNPIFLVVLFLISLPLAAQVDPVDSNGLAVGGYDLVSYFKDGKAVKGIPSIASKHNEAIYYFSSKENKTAFEKSPEAYLPQYEGYCALAIATTAKKISINPELFRVTDGKLYLFFHGKSFSGTTFNSLEPWIADEHNMIKKADGLWPKVKEKKYHRKS